MNSLSSHFILYNKRKFHTSLVPSLNLNCNDRVKRLGVGSRLDLLWYGNHDDVWNDRPYEQTTDKVHYESKLQHFRSHLMLFFQDDVLLIFQVIQFSGTFLIGRIGTGIVSSTFFFCFLCLCILKNIKTDTVRKARLCVAALALTMPAHGYFQLDIFSLLHLVSPNG